MARNITYEIMVQQGTRWEIHARHGGAHKEAALNEAKALELLPKITAVKVIKETYDTQDGDTQEATVYKSAAITVKDEAGAGVSTGPSRVTPSPFGRARGPRSPARVARRARHRPARASAPARMGIFTKILLVIFFSIAFAALITGVMALIIRDFSVFGMNISANAYANILFGVFVVGFLFSAVPLSLKFLSNEGLSSNATRRRADRAPARPARKPPKKEKKLEKENEEPPPPSIDAEDLPTDKEEGPEAEEPAEEKKAEEEAEQEEPVEEEEHPDGDLSPEGEAQKVYMMTFLGQALEHVKAVNKSMDNFNKFGVNLFLAGACEAMSSDRNMDDADCIAVLGEMVEVMGFKKDQAISFANKCDEYLLADSRYMQMYQAGRNAMNTFIGGDADGPRQLQDALVEWDKPKPKEADSGPVTVMFTDMVGSTSLTQTWGDEVAQQVVRAHNRIVRDALNTYGGKEVKHTGDGIMASFPTTSNGVEAAIFIQQKAAIHNNSNAELPLLLKIGINAGEPIAEDDDLFGSTVQLAARIVDKAASEEIYVSEIVRGICAGKDFKFSNQGGFEMKGFSEPITLFEVLWEETEAQETGQATQDETEPTPAVPDPTPDEAKQEAPEIQAPAQEPTPAGASAPAPAGPSAPAPAGPSAPAPAGPSAPAPAGPSAPAAAVPSAPAEKPSRSAPSEASPPPQPGAAANPAGAMAEPNPALRPVPPSEAATKPQPAPTGGAPAQEAPKQGA
jgi:class 3 adenylate cyclase